MSDHGRFLAVRAACVIPCCVAATAAAASTAHAASTDYRCRVLAGPGETLFDDLMQAHIPPAAVTAASCTPMRGKSGKVLLFAGKKKYPEYRCASFKDMGTPGGVIPKGMMGYGMGCVTITVAASAESGPA